MLIRHGDTVFHCLSSFSAQPLSLSLWHEVQGFGIFESSVSAGVMNRKVWLAT
jgi:hypothetical protein